MPTIRSLDPTTRQLERISDFIKRRMREQKKNQSYMAAVLQISQQDYSIKLNSGNFTAGQLIRVFDELKTPCEERGKLITP